MLRYKAPRRPSTHDVTTRAIEELMKLSEDNAHLRPFDGLNDLDDAIQLVGRLYLLLSQRRVETDLIRKALLDAQEHMVADGWVDATRAVGAALEMLAGKPPARRR